MAEFKVASAYADFKVNVDEGIDEAVARIRARGRELDTSAKVVLDADTTEAQARIKELADAKNKATVQADADTTLAKAKLKALGDSKASVKVKTDVDDESLKATGDKVENELGRVAARANATFDAKTFAGLSVGLPAAAAVGAAGVVGSLALVGGAFAALQVTYAQNEDAAGKSIARLGSLVDASVESMSKGMAGPLAQAADMATASFARMRPALDSAFKNSDVIVLPLTRGVTSLAEEAMPGLVTATLNLQGPVEGLSSLLGQTGTGLTNFFTNASEGAQAAGRDFSTLGGIASDALGFLGQFFANVSNNGLPAIQQLQAMLQQAEGALTALTASGSGAIGFLTGFGSAATGMLTVVNALAQGLSLLPPQLTQFAGSITASSLLLQKFGIDGTKAFEGLGERMKAAKATTTPLTSSITELVATAFNPAMLATAGFGIALEILGQHQRDAAAAAQAQTERVQTLAQAMRESNGVIDENVEATAAQALQQFKVSDGTRNLLADSRGLGLNLQQVTAAYLGNNAALGQLNTQLDQTIKANTHQVDTGHGVVTVTNDTAKAAKELRNELNSGDFAKAAQDNLDLANATGQAVKPTTELSNAMDALSGNAASSEQKVTALRTALDIMSGRTPVFEDAIKAGNDQLRTMADSLSKGAKAADGMGKSLINADGTINTVSKNGSSLQGLAEGLQGSFTDAASGIDQMVRRGVPFAEATKKVNDSLTDQRNRFIDIAEKMGLTSKQAGDLADKYGLIPKTVTTDITADTKQAKAAIDALPPYAAGTQGAIVLSADTDPATGKIVETVQYADGSTGVITLDANKDPATGKTVAAVQFADGSRGYMTIDGINTAAKNGTLSAVRFANGSVGTISINANTGPARSTIHGFLGEYFGSITIPVRASTPPGGVLPLGANSVGGLVGSGKIQRFAEGGLAAALGAVDVSPGGKLAGPGTGTSDSMLALVSNTEAVINAKATANNEAELGAINRGERDYKRWPDTGRPPTDNPQARTAVLTSQPITINVYQQPNQDPYVLAAMVSRELELRRRVA